MSERVTYIEIDLPVCSLTYGVGDCSAAIGEENGAFGVYANNSGKCFNTRSTCQYLEGYDEEAQTLRLAVATLNADLDIVAVPNVSSVRYQPPEIMIGQGLGARSGITVSASDHPFPDTGPGGDPYRESRSYHPYETGTFWGKLKARHPFLRNVKMRWITGRVDQPLAAMETREFVLDRIEGPDTSGNVSIIGKDPLSVVDDKRAQAPRVSPCAIAQVGGISDTDTSFTLTPDAAAFTSQYPASGYVALGGKEIVSYTRSGATMTITRGQYNTEAVSHDFETRVQLCLEYDSERISDIIYDLLTTYGNVDPSYIRLNNWNQEADEFLNFNYSALISEPRSVVNLVNEACESGAVSIWWDDVQQTVQFQVIRRRTFAGRLYNEDSIFQNSFRQKENPEKRISQAWVYHAQINPLEQDDPNNYQEVVANVSLESEDSYGTASIKQVFSRWIPAGGFTQAAFVGNLFVSRFALPPRTFSFSVLRDVGAPTPVLGGAAKIESRFIQSPTGEPQTLECQITSIEASDTTWRCKAEELTRSDVPLPTPGGGLTIIPIIQNATGLNLRAEYDAQFTNEPESGDTIRFEIRSGVVIAGTSIASASGSGFVTGRVRKYPTIRTGSWPTGVNVQLNILPDAFVIGAGGQGGRATVAGTAGSETNPLVITVNDGGQGWDAIEATHPITIDNQGTIAGGGGGGGGAAAYATVGSLRPRIVTAVALSGGSAGASISRGGGTTTNINLLLSGDSVLVSNANGNQSSTFDGADSPEQSQVNLDATVSGGTVLSISGSASATGGSGGDYGQAGTNNAQAESEYFGTWGLYIDKGAATGSPGAVGNAVVGDSMVTWNNLGTVLGPRIG
jgi:hypothetical protein